MLWQKYVSGTVKAHMRKLSISFESKRPKCQERFLRQWFSLGEKIFAGQMVSVELRNGWRPPKSGRYRREWCRARIAMYVFTAYQILYLVKAANKIVCALMKCVVWEIHNQQIKNNSSYELWIVPWIKKMG